MPAINKWILFLTIKRNININYIKVKVGQSDMNFKNLIASFSVKADMSAYYIKEKLILNALPPDVHKMHAVRL